MSKQLKLRRGTTAQHSTFTGASGEVTVDTDKKTLVVHDGVTPGGNAVLSAAASAVGTTNIADGAITSVKIADGTIATADIADGAITSAKIADATITTADIADSAITTAKIANANVTAAKLASGAARANFGAGAVLQVVNASLSGAVSTSSNTRSDTGLAATITPTSATSKILVFVNAVGNNKSAGTGSGSYTSFWLMRNSTDIIKFEGEIGYTQNTSVNSTGGCSTSYLDSPATTSPITYKVQFNNPANAGNVSFNNSSSISTITLMEIAA